MEIARSPSLRLIGGRPAAWIGRAPIEQLAYVPSQDVGFQVDAITSAPSDVVRVPLRVLHEGHREGVVRLVGHRQARSVDTDRPLHDHVAEQLVRCSVRGGESVLLSPDHRETTGSLDPTACALQRKLWSALPTTLQASPGLVALTPIGSAHAWGSAVAAKGATRSRAPSRRPGATTGRDTTGQLAVSGAVAMLSPRALPRAELQ